MGQTLSCPLVFLPLGTPPTQNLHLVNARKLDPAASQYIALPHCCGGGIPSKFPTANHHHLSQHIQESSFPQNFQHAIDLTPSRGPLSLDRLPLHPLRLSDGLGKGITYHGSSLYARPLRISSHRISGLD